MSQSNSTINFFMEKIEALERRITELEQQVAGLRHMQTGFVTYHAVDARENMRQTHTDPSG